MTSAGSPHARFCRALATGPASLVDAAARELPTISLADALSVCLVFLADAPELYGRAATRWYGRLCLEAPGLAGAEAQLALAALQALPGGSGVSAARTLAAVCERHSQPESARVLHDWAGNSGADLGTSPPSRQIARSQ